MRGLLYMPSWGPVDLEFRGCIAFITDGQAPEAIGVGLKYGRLRFEPVGMLAEPVWEIHKILRRRTHGS